MRRRSASARRRGSARWRAGAKTLAPYHWLSIRLAVVDLEELYWIHYLVSRIDWISSFFSCLFASHKTMTKHCFLLHVECMHTAVLFRSVHLYTNHHYYFVAMLLLSCTYAPIQ